jgi:hypothetical protein
LHGPGAPQTYGRQELVSHLHQAALGHQEFYYPFPDHKSPRVIISDEAMSEPSFDPAELLICCQARDLNGSSKRLFDDALVFRELSKNGLLGDLSNSFLVVASARPVAATTGTELAVSYSVGRAPEFTAMTRFVRDEKGICVIKEPLVPGLERNRLLPDGVALENVLEPAQYERGSLLLWRLLYARARSGNLDQFVAALSPWFSYLVERSYISTCKRQNGQIIINLSDLFVPGTCLDLTPFNLVDTDRGPVAIDNEWSFNSDIPLGWVMLRSIAHSLSVGMALPDATPHIADVVKALCGEYGIQVSDKHLQMWINFEGEFQTYVSGLKIRKFPLRRNENQREQGCAQLNGPSGFVEQWLAGPSTSTTSPGEAVAMPFSPLSSPAGRSNPKLSSSPRLKGILMRYTKGMTETTLPERICNENP